MPEHLTLAQKYVNSWPKRHKRPSVCQLFCVFKSLFIRLVLNPTKLIVIIFPPSHSLPLLFISRSLSLSIAISFSLSLLISLSFSLFRYMYISIYTHIYTSLFVHFLLYVYIHIHMYVCIYIYIHVCICIYIFLSLFYMSPLRGQEHVVFSHIP